MFDRRTRNAVQAAGLAVFMMLATIASADEVVLRVGGAVDKPLELTRSDLAAMPRDRFDIPTRKDSGVVETWEGVPLIEILRKAGAPVDDRLRGRNLAGYILITGQDGYRAIYALAEIDPGFSPERRILVADKLDGKPLGGEFGNLRIANKGEGKFGRWVRQVVAIDVRLVD